MTLVEAVVVVFVLAIVLAMLLPALKAAKHKGGPSCVNNLKQIGLAYRLWAGDHGDKYPMETSITNGGTMGLADGRNVWINYFVMSNELATPKILLCRQDTNHEPAAVNFSWRLAGHVSYFVGLNADTNHTQAFLAGDDNFEINGAPVKSGLLEFSTNAPIAWTAARHKFSGNILLADGSVQTVTISGLTNLVHQTGLATNRLAIP